MTQLKNRVQFLENILRGLVLSDRYVFQRDVQMMPGRNFQLPTSTGTKFGTATTQKLAFYGVTPVDQPATVSDPSGQANDLDTEARAAINTIIDRLQELGLIA